VKRKKLYYVPGIISIMMLPVLFFFIGPEDPPDYRSIRLTLASTDKDTAGVLKFTEDYIYHKLENKKLVTIDLQSYIWNDTSFSFRDGFSLAVSELQRLQSAHDTSSVLKIPMNSQNSYGDFVWVINEAIIQRWNRYAFIDNSFYLFPEPPPIIDTSRIEDLIVEMPADARMKPPTKWHIFKEEIARNYYIAIYRIETVAGYLFYRRTANKLLAASFLVLIVVPGIIKARKFHMLNKSFTA
jgi:hypothetical protein